MTRPNDYDAYAESIAKQLRAGKQKPHTFIEKPAMHALLPDLKGKKVLCVGCGTGEECGELLGRGAIVEGIDVSQTSIELARTAYSRNPGDRSRLLGDS